MKHVNDKRRLITGAKALSRFVVLGVWAAAVAAHADDGVLRHLRLGYTLRNDSAATVPLAELWVRAPLARTPWQRCEIPTATRGFVLQDEVSGGQVLHFVFTNLAPFAVESIWVDVHVQLLPKPAEATRPASPALLAAADPFDFSDPAFAAALRALAGRKQIPPAELGSRIVRYVQERVGGGAYSAGQRPALDVLRDGRGDCSERMALAVALCRRAGLPARGVGGVVTERNRVVRPSDFHDWGVYHDADGWRLADPGAPEPPDWTRYVAFEWIDGGTAAAGPVRRYRTAGAGVTARMN